MQTHFEDYFARVVKKEHGRVYVYGYCNNLNRTRFREEDGEACWRKHLTISDFVAACCWRSNPETSMISLEQRRIR